MLKNNNHLICSIIVTFISLFFINSFFSLPHYNSYSPLRYEKIDKNLDAILIHPEYPNFNGIRELNIPISFIDSLFNKNIDIRIINKRNTLEDSDGYYIYK